MPCSRHSTKIRAGLYAISDSNYTRGFLVALDTLLHRAGSSSDRLEDFTSVLAGMGLRK